MADSPQRNSHRRSDGTPIALTTHLDDVADRVAHLVPTTAETPAGNACSELARTCALIHDIGKLTTHFQRHLDDSDPSGPTHHAPLGSFAAFYCVEARGFDGNDPLLGFLVVARHHQALPDAVRYVYNRTDPTSADINGPDLQSVRDQIADIDDNASALAEEILRRATDGAGSWSGFVESFDDDHIDRVHQSVCAGSFGLSEDPDALDSDFYDALLQVWSSLCLADKTSAAALTNDVELNSEAYRPNQPDHTCLLNYLRDIRDDAPDTRINRLRDDARSNVLDGVASLDESDTGIGTITLPTGLGKTIAGLDAAMRLRSESSSIIYALPFTAIVDQVASECRSIFETTGHDHTMTVHHHLAETRVDLGTTDPDAVADLETMLGESWRSGLVVTTFVQLFESLAGPANSQSMKIPALDGAVVVLDEPQCLPERWWALVRRLSRLLVDRFDATIIAMTATQPKIFDGDGRDPISLVESPDQYFAEMDRVRFRIDPSARSYGNEDTIPLDYSSAASRIIDRLGAESTLAVCNTIDSAIDLSTAVQNGASNLTSMNEVYDDQLQNRDDMTATLDGETVAGWVRETCGPDDAVFAHLTSRHRPVDRRVFLEAITELLEEDVPVGLISTQIVEAGVDISFDRVYRDFAPLDSIVQAAGRCNRSNDGPQGTVVVWLLDTPGETSMLPTKAVYDQTGDSLSTLSARALESIIDDKSVENPVYLLEQRVTTDAVETYYEMISTRSPGDPEYVEYVDRCEAQKLSKLSLIDQRQAVDVIVARTDDEQTTVKRIDDAFDMGDYETVDCLLDDLREMTVSVPIYDETGAEAQKVATLDPVYAGADRRYVAAGSDRASWFSPDWGLIVPEDTIEGRFL